MDGSHTSTICILLSAFLCSVATAKPTVTDTGFEIFPAITAPTIYWIDNERLLFVGVKRTDMDAAVAAKAAKRVERLRNAYVWDSGNGRVLSHSRAQSVCYADGFASYLLRVNKQTGRQVVKEGRFGSEIETERPIPSREAVLSNFTCRLHSREDLVPPIDRHRNFLILRPGEGYLDLGPSAGPEYLERLRSAKKNLVLYKGGSGDAVTLPMSWDESFPPPFAIAYSAYQGAYVLVPRMPRGSSPGVIGSWPKEVPFLVYLLWADGRSKVISIPYLPIGRLGHPKPFTGGWLFGGSGAPENVALYVYDGRTVLRVESGSVKEIAVSPNGCKAAVGINSEPFQMGTPIALKVFHFCAETR